MRVAGNAAGGAGPVGELFEFLRAGRLVWLTPFVGVLNLTGVWLIVGPVTGIAPFIHTLF